MSGGYVFRKILTKGNHGFNISQHRKMHLTTPFWASRTATLTILDRKIVKVTGRNSQSGDAKQTVSQPKIGCFALKSQLFSSPEQWFWLKKVRKPLIYNIIRKSTENPRISALHLFREATDDSRGVQVDRSGRLAPQNRL